MSVPPCSVKAGGVTYRVHAHKQLGSLGKEGAAYDASDDCGNHVVVKWFRNARKAVARIRTEAELQRRAACLGVSPHVYGVDEHHRVIVMDYARGTLLSTILTDGAPVSAKLQDDILRVNVLLREHGIVHNDSNPRNYFLDKTAHSVTVIDFGFAKAQPPPASAAARSAARVLAAESVALLLGRSAQQAARVLPRLMQTLVDDADLAPPFKTRLAFALQQACACACTPPPRARSPKRSRSRSRSPKRSPSRCAPRRTSKSPPRGRCRSRPRERPSKCGK